jgi:hypothetical protein
VWEFVEIYVNLLVFSSTTMILSKNNALHIELNILAHFSLTKFPITSEKVFLYTQQMPSVQTPEDAAEFRFGTRGVEFGCTY